MVESGLFASLTPPPPYETMDSKEHQVNTQPSTLQECPTKKKRSLKTFCKDVVGYALEDPISLYVGLFNCLIVSLFGGMTIWAQQAPEKFCEWPALVGYYKNLPTNPNFVLPGLIQFAFIMLWPPRQTDPRSTRWLKVLLPFTLVLMTVPWMVMTMKHPSLDCSLYGQGITAAA